MAEIRWLFQGKIFRESEYLRSYWTLDMLKAVAVKVRPIETSKRDFVDRLTHIGIHNTNKAKIKELQDKLEMCSKANIIHRGHDVHQKGELTLKDEELYEYKQQISTLEDEVKVLDLKLRREELRHAPCSDGDRRNELLADIDAQISEVLR